MLLYKKCLLAKAELGLAQLFAAGSGLKECRQALAKWHRMCHDLGLPVVSSSMAARRQSLRKFLGTLTTWEPCKMHKGHYINIWDARCTLAKHNFIELSVPIYVNTKVVRQSISTGKYRRYGMRSSLVARCAILPRAWLLGSAAGGVYSVGPRHAVEQLLGSNGCLPTRSSYSWRFSGRGRGHLWNTTLQRLLRVALQYCCPNWELRDFKEFCQVPTETWQRRTRTGAVTISGQVLDLLNSIDLGAFARTFPSVQAISATNKNVMRCRFPVVDLGDFELVRSNVEDSICQREVCVCLDGCLVGLLVWFGLVWFVWFVWFGLFVWLVWFGLVCLVWFVCLLGLFVGLVWLVGWFVWFGLVWFGLVWFGLVVCLFVRSFASDGIIQIATFGL